MAASLSLAQAVSLIESVAKTPAGYRRAHSRGLVTRGHFVASPEEFPAFTEARRPARKGRPNLLKVLWHIARHVHILAGVKAIKSLRPTGSFAMETYRGLHTYWFRSGQGNRQAFRYAWVPEQAHRPLSPGEAAKRPKQYLLDDLRSRLARGHLVWDLVATLAEPGDALDDASLAWPEGRRRLVLGRLTVERVHEDQKAAEGIVFDPTGVPPGIELSDDPILRFRAAAYGESFRRRSGETRSAPAPADMGQ